MNDINNISSLENKIIYYTHFKVIAEKLTEEIQELQKTIDHYQCVCCEDSLPISPKIYLSSITVKEYNFLFYCGQGIESEQAFSLVYPKNNLKRDTLKLKLTKKACVDIQFFDRLASICYQHMRKNIDFFDIAPINK